MTTTELEKLLADVTPGPWRVIIDDDGNPLSGRPSVQASDELDCGIVHWDGFIQPYWRSARGDKEIHANARLIATAPDLARKVIAAEKLATALRTMMREAIRLAESGDAGFWDPEEVQSMVESRAAIAAWKDAQ